jgi:protein O-mannosyl-transferase
LSSRDYSHEMTELSERRRNVLIYLCLAVAIIVVYWPVCHHEFANYDDYLYVTDNRHVQGGLTLRGFAWAFTTNHAGNWHPLTWLSHMLDWQLWAANAGAHHLVNVLFHIANTLLLFGVLRRMTASPWRSALVAGFFALHPLHVESVAWVAERKDVLSTCFGMLTMWAYVRYVETLKVHGSRFTVQGSALHASVSAEALAKAERFTLNAFYGLALLFFTLGLMAKPMVVTLPFVLLLLDYWPLGRTQWAKPAAGESVKAPPSQLLKEKLPFFALAAVSCVVTYWAQRGGGTVVSLARLPPGMRVANALLSYVGYMGKAFWPMGLAVFYPLQVRLPAAAVMGAGIVLVGMTAAVIGRARREPWFVTGWFWYVGTLVPVIGLVQVGGQSMADRYTYVPLVGLFMMLCWGVPGRAMERQIVKVITCIAAGAVLAVCAALSRVQVGYWKDSETLFRHALDVTRDNWLAHYSLGIALGQAGRLQEAVEHYEQALRIDPDYAEAHNNLGDELVRLGRVKEAIQHYERVLRIDPDYAEVHNNLGNALLQAGRIEEAIGHCEQALRLKPDYAEAHNNLGNALLQAGRPQEAIGHWEQALRLKPDLAEAHYNMGLALVRLGKIQEAGDHWEQALRLKPDFAEAHNSLGLVLKQQGKIQDAIRHYEQALRVKPNHAEAQNNLAWALATLGPAEGGDPVRAVTLAQRACDLTGNRAATYLDTLAVAYAAAGRFTDAIATAQKAIELARSARQPELVREIETRLQLYRGGRAYRELRSPVRSQSADVTAPHNP